MSEENGHTGDTVVAGSVVDAPSTEDVHPPSTTKIEPLEHENISKQVNGITAIDNVSTTDVDMEGDSEAETLIQSPEKKRNNVDGVPSLQPTNGDGASLDVSEMPADEVHSRKRKRSIHEGQIDVHSPNTSRRSSPLSSPIAHTRSIDSGSDRSTGKSIRNFESSKLKRDGGRERSPGSETSITRKRRIRDNLQGHRRERRSIDNGERRETRSATYPRPSDDERSPSPRLNTKREHRRGASTQLTGQEFERKKRGRPPLISTRRNRSVERTGSPESEDDSPAPARSALHKFASHDHDTMSPAKTGPRKWRDKNGRTWVARAANNNDLEGVKAKLLERPEDLNLADNAGNSPLQIAALEGFVDIVEYLLEQGCEVDSRNIDKDTPLIDAVENGHLEVVELLLTHGANPRLGNAKGDEPYELVPSDDENYIEIRRLLAAAKERDSSHHRLQDQNEMKDREGGSSSRAASAASPRDSPPIGPRSPPAIASRRRTGRSESTRNDLLWQANTPENLTKLAGRGDTQGVASILNILQKAGTEPLIAAAKAGHEEVLQLLLGMGNPDPDPDPVRSLNPGFNTPLLAAIGRGHVDVVKLLVSQSGFNPCRKFGNKTYFDYAEERKGQDWKQEYDVLKSAYDRYMLLKGRKQGSPRKTRDLEKIKSRIPRRSTSPVSQKRVSSSPTMTHKSLPTKSTESSPKERRKADPGEKRKLASHRQDFVDSTIAVSSDLEQTIAGSKKGHRPRRSHSDLPIPRNLDGDAPYRRRRLVTGKEHRRNKSTAPESGSSGAESADFIEVKQEDRPTPSLKRSRSSQTPESKHNDESDKARLGVKKRRTVESSPEESRAIPARLISPALSRQASESSEMQGIQTSNPVVDTKTSGGDQQVEIIDNEDESSSNRPTAVIAAHFDVPLVAGNPSDDPVASDDTSPVITDVTNNTQQAQTLILPARSEVLPPSHAVESNVGQSPEVEPKVEHNPHPEAPIAISNANHENGKDELTEEQAPRQRAVQSEGAEDIVKDKELDAERDDKAAAAEVTKREEDARKLAEQQEAAEIEARQQAEIAAKQAEIVARKQAEAEAEAEAEALAKRKREEEEMQREIIFRQRQEDAENERRRIEALPAMLAECALMLNRNDPKVRSSEWLKQKFLPLFTVKTRQLDPTVTTAMAEAEWIPSFQVAGLFATKDLALRSYTTLTKRPVTKHEHICMWRVARIYLSYEYFTDPFRTTIEEGNRRERTESAKFLAMKDLHWVKLSDFKERIPDHDHLKDVRLLTQPISLKIYTQEIESSSVKASPQQGIPLTNGIYANGA